MEDTHATIYNEGTEMPLYDENEAAVGQKRRFSTSCLSMKTVLRWRLTGDINLDHLFGCSDSFSEEEKMKAEEILIDSGQLICTLCNTPISANKKAVRRHQTKNRNHTTLLEQLMNGSHVIDRNTTLMAASTVHLRPVASKKLSDVKPYTSVTSPSGK